MRGRLLHRGGFENTTKLTHERIHILPACSVRRWAAQKDINPETGHRHVGEACN